MSCFAESHKCPDSFGTLILCRMLQLLYWLTLLIICFYYKPRTYVLYIETYAHHQRTRTMGAQQATALKNAAFRGAQGTHYGLALYLLPSLLC